MKFIKLLFLGGLLFVPIVSSAIYFSWQVTAIFFLVELVLLFLYNIEDLEVFKIGKDSIEIKTRIKEAKVAADKLEKLSTNFLKVQIMNIMKVGYSASNQGFEELKILINIQENLTNNDLEVIILLKRAIIRLIIDIHRDLRNLSIGVLAAEENLGIEEKKDIKKIAELEDLSLIKDSNGEHFLDNLDNIVEVLRNVVERRKIDVNKKYKHVDEYDRVVELDYYPLVKKFYKSIIYLQKKEENLQI